MGKSIISMAIFYSKLLVRVYPHSQTHPFMPRFTQALSVRALPLPCRQVSWVPSMICGVQGSDEWFRVIHAMKKHIWGFP